MSGVVMDDQRVYVMQCRFFFEKIITFISSLGADWVVDSSIMNIQHMGIELCFLGTRVGCSSLRRNSVQQGKHSEAATFFSQKVHYVVLGESEM